MEETRMFVDRIEGDKAVLVPEDAQSEHVVSLTDMPHGVRESDWVTITLPEELPKGRGMFTFRDGEPKPEIKIDRDAAKEGKARVQNLMDELQQ